MTPVKLLDKTKTNQTLLEELIQEIRFLRSELRFFLPKDDLSKYAHPTRIKRSYKQALKQFPVELWK